ncbi:MAG: hypothetical protein K2X43_15485 [Hyphomonadaceae bacterium]|nr:hypothetical protein [Hyphomonadaceae bacterium]
MAVEASPVETVSETWFSALRSSLYVIRVPVIMAVAVVLVLTLPEQVQEIYRALARDRPNTPGFQYHWLLALAALVGLSLVLWQVARGLSYDFPKHFGTPHPVAGWVLSWVPRLLVMVPLLGAALGLWLCIAEDVRGSDALLHDFVEGVARLRLDFAVAMGTSVVLAIVLFGAATLFEGWLARRGPNHVRRVADYSNWLFFPLIAVASVAIIASDEIRMSQFFGAVPIFALWMAILALIVGLLARLSLFAIPVLGLLVVYGLGIEFFKLADNHEIRSQRRQIDRVALDDAFKQWLANRKDFAAYQAAQRPYPVYIVAAEGGGLYAAYLTARFLARMQDLCPSFAQHVFTISSVSGGSLGAAVFAGLAAGEPTSGPPQPCKAGPARFGPMERQVHRMLSSDFLSPAVWGALYPDFVQRFIPKPFPALDRAVYLERAFERAWPKSAAGANPMAQSFFDLCGSDMSKCLAGSTPLLAFNVTNVETGLQVVLSPVDLQYVGAYRGGQPVPSRKVYDFFGLAGVEPFDMPLSTAVGLSARFPWISPPGWYAWRDDAPPKEAGQQAPRQPTAKKVTNSPRLTFVDGGFVDNSGVATALNIAQHLDAINPRPNVEFRILMISALWAPIDRLWIEPPRDNKSGEVTPPIEAAINARQGRGFKTQFDAALEAKPGLSVTEIGFYYGYLELPLGWQLSDVSRRYIRLFRGEPERCRLDSEESYIKHTGRSVESHEQAAVAYIKRADCVVARIRNELTPTEPPLPPPSWPPINPTR